MRDGFILRVLLSALSLFIVSCATVERPTRIDNVPMYGQPDLVRPAFLQQADRKFVETALSGFGGDSAAASDAWFEEGNRYLQALNFDYAMRRFNQSWLLKKDSYKPYWGFGRVLVQKNKFAEAIGHFATSVQLCTDNYQKPALLSDMAVAYSWNGEFELANMTFQRSVDTDPKYPNSWMRWSQSLFKEGRVLEAKEKLDVAIGLGAKPPRGYVQQLESSAPK